MYVGANLAPNCLKIDFIILLLEYEKKRNLFYYFLIDHLINYSSQGTLIPNSLCLTNDTMDKLFSFIESNKNIAIRLHIVERNML